MLCGKIHEAVFLYSHIKIVYKHLLLFITFPWLELHYHLISITNKFPNKITHFATEYILVSLYFIYEAFFCSWPIFRSELRFALYTPLHLSIKQFDRWRDGWQRPLQYPLNPAFVEPVYFLFHNNVIFLPVMCVYKVIYTMKIFWMS